MAEPHGWRHMASAPKDGSRILATVAESEQGPAQVDTVYWASADDSGIEGWRSSDSTPGQVFSYADPEIICWMPVPGADADVAPGGGAALMPEPWDPESGVELFGSGI